MPIHEPQIKTRPNSNNPAEVKVTNGNMWELCKENIQPLSKGRKFAVLNQSLTSGAEQFDQSVSEMLQNFEQELHDYVGNDPLSVWVRCFEYYEQKCLGIGRYQVQYNDLLKECVRKFINHAEWKNDKRFVEILLKCMRDTPCDRRAQLCHGSLIAGVGINVSIMYIQIAEDFEALKNYERASEVLQMGKENNAQPAAYLEEFTLNFQVRVAEAVSQKLKDENEAREERIRGFGSSVPTDFQNEAQNFRIGLPVANASRARLPISQTDPATSKVAVYHQNENDENRVVATIPYVDPIVELQLKDKLDQENFIEPSKWSKPENVLNNNVNNPVPIPLITEKIQIYEDSENPVVVIPDRKLKRPARPVLHERKIESETEEGQLSDEPRVLASVAAIVAVPIPEQQIPPLSANQKLICRVKDLWLNGKEVTFEHLRAAEYRKRKMQRKICENQVEKFEIENRSKRDAEEIAALKCQVAELEYRIKQCQIEAEQERRNHANQIQCLVQKLTCTSTNLPPPSENARFASARSRVEIKPVAQIDEGMKNPTGPFAGEDETEVILRRNANNEPDFDVSNLTRALNFHPPPMHNSTPERARRDDVTRTLYSKPDSATDSLAQQNVCAAKLNFNQTMHIVHNLSTIQETSKESRSSTTSSSGSTANYTKSASAQRTAARSQLASSTMHSQYYQDWMN